MALKGKPPQRSITTSKNSSSKKGQHLHEAHRNKRGNTVCTWRLFYILDSCFFLFFKQEALSRMPWHQKKCDKRFVKVVEEGGLEEGHF